MYGFIEATTGSKDSAVETSGQCGKAVYSFAVACLGILFLTISTVSASASDVVFIHSSEVSGPEHQQMENAARFYGLNLKLITLEEKGYESALTKAVERRETVAVAIAANALGLVSEKSLLHSLHRASGNSIPLLIVGVTPQTDSNALRIWSGDAVVGSMPLPRQVHPRYVFGRIEGITKQLSDIEVPFSGYSPAYLVLGNNGRAEKVMAVRSDNGDFPVFVQVSEHGTKIFLSCGTPSTGERKAEWNSENLVGAFAEIAPAMIFTRYSAGEHAWHALYHYANLTIDDPWLRQSYGFVDYKGLLAEMDKHNFHTTIAFIPWNFDRSQPEVVSLFRNHPDRFSICIHGDNHDHKEFTDYRSKPLADQIEGLKQAIARMERFRALTGIPYDRVMVFPHSIAPERTIEALKTYDYLATINASNTPIDHSPASWLSSALRPVTLEYSNFASIRRSPAQVPVPSDFIAMSEFLDNPVLFYCHHDFFASGIGSFDLVADEVNRVEPDTRWGSVGDLVKHLYLVKLRDDSGYDVLSFTSDLRLDNSTHTDSTFYIRKPESDAPAISSVVVDGRPFPYLLRDGYLELAVPILAGRFREINIHYQSDLNLAAVNIAKHSARIRFLRTASDFRDVVLFRYSAGRLIVGLYYERPAVWVSALACLLILISLLICSALRLRKMISMPARASRAETRR